MMRNFPTIIRRLLCLFVAAWSCLGHAQSADAYPRRAIHLTVVFAPGGGADVAARLVAPKLAERLGQPVVVENRPGMGGGIGADYVAKSAPDGYNLVLASSGGLTALPFLYKNVAFSPEKDLTPITTFGVSPLVLVAGPSFPGNSVKDVIALARQQPGVLAHATAGGNGTAPHLAAELFKVMTDTQIIHVPYKGGAPALMAVIAGDVPLGFIDLATVRPYLEGGKVRALAVLGKNRTSVAPQIPTVAESGVPGYEADGWFALMAPAGTPAPIVARLNKELRVILDSPDVKAHFASVGLEPTSSSPEEVTQMMRRDSEKWGKLIKEHNLSAD
jgi:tripartite-type tricarboxylate transporter receptor subunit TctC